MEVNETTRPLTEVPAENTPETPVSTVENDEKTLYSPKQTQEEVIERLTEINNNACDADKQEIDYLKQTFYKLHKSEQDTAHQADERLRKRHTVLRGSGSEGNIREKLGTTGK